MKLTRNILSVVAILALTLTGTSGAQAVQKEAPSREVLQPVSLTERLASVNVPQVVVPTDAETSVAYVEIPPVIPAPEPIVEPVAEPELAAPAFIEAPAPVISQEAYTPPQQAAAATVEPVAAVQTQSVAPEPTVQPVTAPISGVGAALAASALGQIGIAQDCTAMVENALRSIGKSVGDLAPAQFYAFGSVVGSPELGDLVITSGHVAIYVGGGMVVSGGFNGMNTEQHPLSYLSGASFVRVR